MFDGTTGKACASDVDCKGVGAGAPGINKCTSVPLFQGGELFPTPVCLMPVECDPCGGQTPCDGLIHGCDGPDGDPSTAGICLPNTPIPTVGKGTCWPACSFAADGSAPVGCVGKDACNVAAYGIAGTTPHGVGLCLGGCTADGDCAGGERCDATTGLCLKSVTAPTKNLGDGCTMAEAQATPPSCNCIYNSNSGLGFCSKFCTVPATGAANPCPAGWFCETEEPTTIAGANDASVAGFTTQNVGLAGFCVRSCATGADSGVCPVNTTCLDTFAGGPGCIP
jgi:hypothetical protein